MELKLGSGTSIVQVNVAAFNRTNVELKQAAVDMMLRWVEAFNRTNVELKPAAFALMIST